MRYLKASTTQGLKEKTYLISYLGDYFLAVFSRDKNGFQTREGKFIPVSEEQLYYCDFERSA